MPGWGGCHGTDVPGIQGIALDIGCVVELASIHVFLRQATFGLQAKHHADVHSHEGAGGGQRDGARAREGIEGSGPYEGG